MAAQRIDLVPAVKGSAPLDDVAVRLRPADDVAIARVPLAPGLRLEMTGGDVTVRQSIPQGHKVALTSKQTGEAVHRYGAVIGFATQPIETGEHVHTHNLHVGHLEHDYAFCQG